MMDTDWWRGGLNFLRFPGPFYGPNFGLGIGSMRVTRTIFPGEPRGNGIPPQGQTRKTLIRSGMINNPVALPDFVREAGAVMGFEPKRPRIE